MHVNDICKQTGLTKKAVAYYQLKGLVAPKVNANGYREYSDSDLSRLKEIALFRKLDLNVDEIRRILDSKDKNHTLASLKQAKGVQIKAKLNRLDLLGQLIDGVGVNEIADRLNILDQQLTIIEKLVIAFPGYFGKYFSLHFSQFLNEPIKTEEQKRQYDKIVDFLDNMDPLEIPEEFQAILDEADSYMTDEKIQDIIDNMHRAYDDFDTYWENNKESIKQYADFKKTDAYQNSVMSQLMASFREFGQASGYYDVFIPTMRKLSPAYDSYYAKMLEANKKLIQKMPDIE